jgi:hypothetical protein
VSAAKYCPHGAAVESRLADVRRDTAAIAADLGSGRVEREDFTQEAGRRVSVEREGSAILIHDS